MRAQATKVLAATIVFILIVTISLQSASTKSTNSAAVPVINLVSIHGYSAEISDYHFDAQQNFCFTLSNTSELPINAIGADLGPKAFVSITSQTADLIHLWYAEAFPYDHTLNGVPMSFVLFSLGGLDPGASITICLSGLGGPPEDITHNLFVTFRPEVSLGCTDNTDPQSGTVLVQFTRSREAEQCVIIANPSNEVVTGVGLNLTDLTNSFDLLSVTPDKQPFNQHLRFAKNPGSVDDLGNVPLNFALLSGGQFSRNSPKGVGPGEITSRFCIAGNFAGLTTEEVIKRTYVRVNDKTRQCFNNCCPVGQGQTGILAGEPR